MRAALTERNVDLVFVPGGCTALAQPVDVGIAKSFMDGVRDCWVEWMTQPRPPTVAGNLTQPTRQDVINWVGHAWERVNPDAVTKAFLRCAISNALDGSEDDQTLEWFPDDIAAFLPANGAEMSSDSDSGGQEQSGASQSEGEEEVDGGIQRQCMTTLVCLVTFHQSLDKRAFLNCTVGQDVLLWLNKFSLLRLTCLNSSEPV